MNLYKAARQVAEKQPEKQALIIHGICLTNSITFADFLNKIDSYASILHKNGIKSGDVVIIDLKNTIGAYAALFALFKLNATAYIYNPNIQTAYNKPKAIISNGLNIKFHTLFRKIPLKFATGKIRLGYINLNSKTTNLDLESKKVYNPAIIYHYKNKNGLISEIHKNHECLYDSTKQLCIYKKSTYNTVSYSTKYSDNISNIANGRPTILIQNKPKIFAKLLWKNCLESLCIDSFNMQLALKYIKTSVPKVKYIFLYDNSVKTSLLTDLQKHIPNASIYMYFCIHDIIVTELDFSEVSDKEYARTYQGKGVLVGYDTRQNCIKIHGADSDFTVGEILIKPTDFNIYTTLNNNIINIDGSLWLKTGKAGYFDDLGRLWYMGDYANTIKIDGKEIFIFSIEESVNSTPYVNKSAFVVNNNTRILYVELTNTRFGYLTEDIKKETNTNFGCNLVEQIKIGPIPMSRKNPLHIDYKKLMSE